VNERGGLLQGRRFIQHFGPPSKDRLGSDCHKSRDGSGIMSDCIQAGVGGAVIISGGFAETEG